MPTDSPYQAWNNFVMHIDPLTFEADSIKRYASLANLFMGMVNNGGINHFLTASYDFGADEYLHALKNIGAKQAVKEFDRVLKGLGEPVPQSSQDERWDLVMRLWTDELDGYDSLSEAADSELLEALEQHVGENEAFYLTLKTAPD